ncbi:uncharacterized protein LOC133197827 [Saccostrea echinata]|uniref:uncharacterized protein LOC133197827 n=1 Tax=Saccostrea echinata TaxID=191078 RepID=UPI002A81A71F|nr:uncharacterized protein LOC133197827 [Saccostrea echinata]
MDWDSEATEIEEESLHLHFSSGGECSESILSTSTPQTKKHQEQPVSSSRKTATGTFVHRVRPLSSSDSDDIEQRNQSQKKKRTLNIQFSGVRRSPRKAVKNSDPQTQQPSQSESGNDKDSQHDHQAQKKNRSMVPTTVVRRSPRKQSQGISSSWMRQLSPSESDNSDDLPTFQTQKRKRSTGQNNPQRKAQQVQSVASQETVMTPCNANQSQPASVSSGRTPSNSSGLKTQISQILANQNEILQQLAIVKKDVREVKAEIEKKKQEISEPVQVPARIRSAVKDSYLNGQQTNLKWNCNKRFMDEENSEMTDFIRKSVQGITPDESIDVINAAIKRYFTSQKEADNRQKKNKTDLHKKRQATYERKKEKLKRRLVALEKKTGWSQEKKVKVKSFLQLPNAYKYMSSDEEGDDGFVSHSYSWESEELQKIKDSLDKKYLDTCPPRSKRLLSKRSRGSIRQQDPPKLASGHDWVLNIDS